MSGTAPQPLTAPQNKIGWLGIAGVVTGVLFCLVKALCWSKGFLSAEVFGYAVGAHIIPGLIAYAIAGRAAKRNWNNFGLWFAAFSFFFLLLEVSNAYRRAQ